MTNIARHPVLSVKLVLATMLPGMSVDVQRIYGSVEVRGGKIAAVFRQPINELSCVRRPLWIPLKNSDGGLISRKAGSSVSNHHIDSIYHAEPCSWDKGKMRKIKAKVA